MTTPWNRISRDFREWLESSGATAEEFNADDLQGRAALKKQFDELQHSKRQKRSAYAVHVVVQGARNSAGARGNVFKMLQKYHAVYATSEGINVKYEEDDLEVNALFFEQSDAFDFQNALNEWEIHKELANLSGV